MYFWNLPYLIFSPPINWLKKWNSLWMNHHHIPQFPPWPELETFPQSGPRGFEWMQQNIQVRFPPPLSIAIGLDLLFLIFWRKYGETIWMNATGYSDPLISSIATGLFLLFGTICIYLKRKCKIKDMGWVYATKLWDVLNVTIGGKFQVTILPSPFRSRDRKPYCWLRGLPLPNNLAPKPFGIFKYQR